MSQEFPHIAVKGHVHIQDDLGNVLVDEDNAVHPQNMAHILARALSNEDNSRIHRIAFGNGGTITDAAFTTTFNAPNDGQPPDERTWDSRLYNETYSEIIDEGNATLNVLLGTDPGSAGPNVGFRPGGGASPANDPTAIPHISGPGVHSNDLGLTSEVVITAILNPSEPTGQFATDVGVTDTESSFTFDEIGLYTTGAPAIDSNGRQDIDVGNRTSEDDTGLTADTQYNFDVVIDGGSPEKIYFHTPVSGGSGTGGEILYGDLCEAINTGDTSWNGAWSGSPLPGIGSTISITSNTLAFPTLIGSQTFGFLQITSGSVGATSSVLISAGSATDPTGPSLDLIAALNPPVGGAIIAGVPGQDAGVQNDPVTPINERERLLTHIVFSPVLKSANRTLTITYTLTVSVARTQV